MGREPKQKLAIPIQGNIRRLGVTSPPVSPSEARKVTISGTVTPLGRNWARTKQTPKTPTTKIKPVFPCNVPISPRIFVIKGVRLKAELRTYMQESMTTVWLANPAKASSMVKTWVRTSRTQVVMATRPRGCRPLSKPTQRTTRQNRFAICVRVIPCIICIASILSLLFVFVIWIVQSKCVWPLWLH